MTVLLIGLLIPVALWMLPPPWQFCRKEHVSESLRMDHKLLITKDNQQVTVPIAVEYRRLNDAELAEPQPR
jgi:hypothetical protein